jgi:DNA-binding MarR family transcriptional regulator
MDNHTLNGIAENLLYVLPMIHKKLLKINPPNMDQGLHLSRLHVGIMGIIHEQKLSGSEIARRFLISKPQMTLLINQLVNAGMMERQLNKFDRRIIDINLTAKGNKVLFQCGKILKNNIKEALSDLTEKEQEDLAISLQKLRSIGEKWENHGK